MSGSAAPAAVRPGKAVADGCAGRRGWIVAAVVAVLLALPFAVEHIAPAMTPETLPPGPLYRVVIGLVAYLDRVLLALTPPNLAVFRQGMGMVHTAELYTVARLRIADHVPSDGSAVSSLTLAHNITGGTCADAAAGAPSSCGAVAQRVTRLLRATSTYAVFREAPAGSELWAHTAQSRFLSESHPASMRAVMLNFGDVQYRMMAELPATVVTGEASFLRVHGAEFWSWYAAHPESHAVFDATMHQLGRLGGADAAVSRDVPWYPSVSTVVDVGGGHGLQAASILAAHPGLSAGVVLDMPHVVARAREVWADGLPASVRASSSVLPRLSWVAGDMFDPSTIPSSHREAARLAQAQGTTVCVDQVASTYGYALRDILHDWPDEECVRILASLRANMRGGSASTSRGGKRVCYEADGSRVEVQGATTTTSSPQAVDRVFIIGRLIVPGASFVSSLGSQDADIVMLAAFGTTAGERTVEQYSTLLAGAGLKLAGVHPTRSHYAVVEAVVA